MVCGTRCTFHQRLHHTLSVVSSYRHDGQHCGWRYTAPSFCIAQLHDHVSPNWSARALRTLSYDSSTGKRQSGQNTLVSVQFWQRGHINTTAR